MDFQKILRALLSDVYKMTDGEIDEILNSSDAKEETATATLLQKDRDRVAKLQAPRTGQTFQDGYKKAKAEERGTFEKEIKEHFGIEEDLTGIDLIGAVIAAKASEGAKGEVAKLTTEDLRKLPQFQAIQRDFNKSLNDQKTQYETKLTEVENGFKREATFGNFAKKAREILTGLNPVLPGNQTAADRQVSAYLETFKEYEWQDQNGVFVPLKDGKVVDDGHGNALDFEKLVKERAAEWFDFKANNGGSNGGNGKPGENGGKPTPGYPAGIQKPKTWAEVELIVNDTKIPNADRQIVLQTWETEHATGN